MARERSEDDRKPVEIDNGRFERVGPSLDRRIEDGPRLHDVVALKANATQVAGYTVDAVAAHQPAGFHLVATPVALDLCQDEVAGMLVNPIKREDRFT